MSLSVICRLESQMRFALVHKPEKKEKRNFTLKFQQNKKLQFLWSYFNIMALVQVF